MFLVFLFNSQFVAICSHFVSQRGPNKKEYHLPSPSHFFKATLWSLIVFSLSANFCLLGGEGIVVVILVQLMTAEKEC